MNNPRLGIIIPDRGDRPAFLQHCLRMMEGQSLRPEIIQLINQPAESAAVDITVRYRRGYEALRGKGLDAIFLIENDDWYAADYLETVYNAWLTHNKPDIFGQTYTIYYHLNLKRYFTFHHMDRSSAMNTLLKPDLQFDWCKDEDPYTDMHLWQTLKGITWTPPHIVCLGIKHGIGLCGGYMHFNRLHRFDTVDDGLLAKTVDGVSMAFYNTFPFQEFDPKPDMDTMYPTGDSRVIYESPTITKFNLTTI